ncbi:hypothetical protein IX41_06695 [Kocuria rhizophila]|nr:hypothetical protein IX41_06695 [Kocuria rhizophila]
MLHLRAELSEMPFDSFEVGGYFKFGGVLQSFDPCHLGEEFDLLRFVPSDQVDRDLFHELDDLSQMFVSRDAPVPDLPTHLVRQSLVKVRPATLERGSNLYFDRTGPWWTQDYMHRPVPGMIPAPTIKHFGRHTTIQIMRHDRLDHGVLLIKSHVSLEPDPSDILDAGQLVVRLPLQLVPQRFFSLESTGDRGMLGA